MDEEQVEQAHLSFYSGAQQGNRGLRQGTLRTAVGRGLRRRRRQDAQGSKWGLLKHLMADSATSHPAAARSY
ncbi:hypothetical protein HPB50_010437 [Hyalomma asiaticum]|uniref:Uncharacterized protein n=1 Tax=Hyalomma asiaticum TaxID=266040 RepID=A0ACB7T3V7_HYAAI|nr:hypothetical protein HPB50_010437 [Hyalomma asiaticum]